MSVTYRTGFAGEFLKLGMVFGGCRQVGEAVIAQSPVFHCDAIYLSTGRCRCALQRREVPLREPDVDDHVAVAAQEVGVRARVGVKPHRSGEVEALDQTEVGEFVERLIYGRQGNRWHGFLNRKSYIFGHGVGGIVLQCVDDSLFLGGHAEPGVVDRPTRCCLIEVHYNLISTCLIRNYYDYRDAVTQSQAYARAEIPEGVAVEVTPRVH